MSLPEHWTLLRRAAPSVDPSTGNNRPGSITEVPWRGLIQVALIERRTDEPSANGALTELLLLLDPGIVTSREDVWRFDGPASAADLVKVGQTVQVKGTPRVRRPVRGTRPDSYIVAVVRYATDLME